MPLRLASLATQTNIAIPHIINSTIITIGSVPQAKQAAAPPAAAAGLGAFCCANAMPLIKNGSNNVNTGLKIPKNDFESSSIFTLTMVISPSLHFCRIQFLRLLGLHLIINRQPYQAIGPVLNNSSNRLGAFPTARAEFPIRAFSAIISRINAPFFFRREP